MLLQIAWLLSQAFPPRWEVAAYIPFDLKTVFSIFQSELEVVRKEKIGGMIATKGFWKTGEYLSKLPTGNGRYWGTSGIKNSS